MMALWKLAVLLLASMAICTGCRKLSTAETKTVFGDQATYDIVRAPDRVDAYRVGGWQTADPKTGGYKDLAGPITVPAEVVAKLSGILGDRRTFSFNLAKGCEFDPGVRLRFIKSDKSVDVLLCFHCLELQVVRDGKQQGGEDFDNQEAALIAIAKKLFPDDKDIVALKPQD
jgi:hypothetical protein